MAKIAIIGAGSLVFCKTLMNDFLATPALAGSEYSLMALIRLTGPAAARESSREMRGILRSANREERLPNKEIADRLGYCDEFHFSRRFRQVTGQTPRAVREAFFGRAGS
jgi:AraC-like DNA-binding protein